MQVQVTIELIITQPQPLNKLLFGISFISLQAIGVLVCKYGYLKALQMLNKNISRQKTFFFLFMYLIYLLRSSLVMLLPKCTGGGMIKAESVLLKFLMRNRLKHIY